MKIPVLLFTNKGREDMKLLTLGVSVMWNETSASGS